MNVLRNANAARAYQRAARLRRRLRVLRVSDHARDGRVALDIHVSCSNLQRRLARSSCDLHELRR